jgi:hypothetical protein
MKCGPSHPEELVGRPFSCDEMSGTLPGTLGSLPGLAGLKELSFGGPISGTLPPEWGSGPGLVGLEQLHFSRMVDMYGAILPSEWGTGPGLAKLQQLGAHRFSGTIPCSWAKFDQLKIEAENCGLLGCFPTQQLADRAQIYCTYDGPMVGVRGECWCLLVTQVSDCCVAISRDTLQLSSTTCVPLCV